MMTDKLTQETSNFDGSGGAISGGGDGLLGDSTTNIACSKNSGDRGLMLECGVGTGFAPTSDEVAR